MLQAPRIMSEFRPFLASPVTVISTFAHQSSKIESVSLGCGAREESPTRCRREYQNYLQQQQQHSLLSQVSWGRLEMKPKRDKKQGDT
jgi:hypothetical protein